MTPEQYLLKLRTLLPVEVQRARTDRRTVRVDFPADMFAKITWEGSRYVGELFNKTGRLSWYADDDPGELADQLLEAWLKADQAMPK